MPCNLDPDLFARALAGHRADMKAHARRRNVPPELLRRFGSVYEDLRERGCDQEALEIVRLILEGVDHVVDRVDRVGLSYAAWRRKAVTSGLLGLWEESIEAYEKAISFGERGEYGRVAKAHPDPGREAVYEPADHRELGSMHGRVGAFGDARESFSRAEQRLEEVKGRLDHHTHRDESGRLLNARAIVHSDLGEHEEAESNALAAAQIQEALGEEKPRRFLQAAIDYVTVGRARREYARRENGSYAPSFAAFDDALRVLNMVPEEGRDREHSDRESEARLQRGRTRMLAGDYDTALADLKEARSLTSNFNLVQHAGEHDLFLGEAHLELANIRPAKKCLEEAITLAEGRGTPETLWQSRRALASVHRAEDRPQEARNELKECIETIEGLRSQHLPESSKISMLEPKDRPYEELVIDLCSSRSGTAEAPEIAQAFGYVERSKSRVLTERLATRELPVPAGVPAGLVEEERERVGSLMALQDPASRVDAANGAYDLRARVEEAERQVREARNRIRACGTGGEEYAAMREAAPLDYAGIRDILAAASVTGGGDGTGAGGVGNERARRLVLLQYFVAEEAVFAFVGRADFEEPRLYKIVGVSRDDLRVWAEIFAALKPRNYESLWNLDAWQGEMGRLAEPIGECSDEGDVVWIVPHRELHRLPLHALEVGERYLAERNPVFYTPSASVFRYSRAKNQEGVPQNAVVFGDSLPEVDPLPSAAEEAIAVAVLFKADAHLGDRATKDALYEELRHAGGEVDVLHFACHGKFEPENPLKSRIKLAPGTGGGHEDSDLTAQDVLGLDLKAAIVTLSACESGLSKIRPGEELVGLTRSFLYAGTPSLLVSLWSVADDSTGMLMERFYEALLNPPPGDDARTRMNKAEALHAAQRSVKSDGRFDHPFHWSSFVLVGDWE